MKIGYLITGFILLSNPNVGIVDVLPDVIGFLLIMHGIGVAKLLSPNLKEAFRYSVILSCVNSLKAFCVPLVFVNIRSLPIVLSFSFALIECSLLILFVGKFFEGLFYLGIRYDIKSIFNGNVTTLPAAAGKGRPEKGVIVKRFAIVFFIFRSLISVFPDLSDLQLTTKAESELIFSDLNGLVVLTVIVLGIIGAAFFLFKLIPYFHSVSKEIAESDFEDHCKSISNDPSFQEHLRIRRFIVLLSFAAATSLFVSVDGLIIPSAVSAMFIVLAAISFGFFDKKVYFVIIPAVIGSIVSLENMFVRYEYYIEMHNAPEASLWSPASGAVYDRIAVYNLIERLCLLLSLVLLFVLLYKKIRTDINDRYQDHGFDRFESENSTSFLKKYLIWIVAGILLYLMSAFEPLLLIEIDIISVLLTVLNTIWIVVMILHLTDAFKSYYPLKVKEERTE